ncbi:MAG: hypothetical protein A4S09_06005 [Proteobacteria bacterium SG_bin7]|nr:MAG: hypothetical protein A4S09_06005 [Proteobacteria bacterium SG_bin7]
MLRCLCLILLIPFSLACSTLSKEECAQGDWYNIGLRDGQHGYTPNRISEHAKACAEYGSRPDNAVYSKGHTEGLKTYCTPENGYQVGLQGQIYHQVCPANLSGAFQKKYRLGYRIYELKREINQIDNNLQNLYSKIGDPKTPGYERGVATGQIGTFTYQKASKERELGSLEAQAAMETGTVSEPGFPAGNIGAPIQSNMGSDGPLAFLFDTYKPTAAMEEWIFEMTATRTDGSRLPKRKYTIRLKANKNSDSVVNTHKLEMANSVGKFKTLEAVDPSNIGDAIQTYYKQNPGEDWVAWLSGVWEGRMKKNSAMTWSGNPGTNGSVLEGSGMKLQVVSNCIWQGRQGFRVKISGTGNEIDKCQISDQYFPTWALVKKPTLEVEAKLVKYERK